MIIKYKLKHKEFTIDIEEFYSNDILNNYKKIIISRRTHYDIFTKILHKQFLFSYVVNGEKSIIKIKKLIDYCLFKVKDISKDYDIYDPNYPNFNFITNNYVAT